ncbi:MAG TPA: hypothetical protein IAB21_03535 [Candidatus Avelusimicrobium excrementipullorum]|nr:hypothetical protein [Candidatus Avelusimicrobium excrementipullorum]
MFKKLLVFLCRRPKADPSVCSRARSVLIRPLSPALGDGIMTTAALAQLKEALPGVRTGVIVNERNRDLFSLCPLADELVPDGLTSALRQRGRWDIYLDYPRTFNTTAILFAFLLRPLLSVAFDKENKKAYTSSSVKVYDLYCPNRAMYHLNSYLKLTPLAFAVKEPVHYVLRAPQTLNPYPQDGKINILLAPWGSTRRLEPRLLAQAVAANAAPDVRFWLLNDGKSEGGGYLPALQIATTKADIAQGKSPSLYDFLAYIYYADGIFAIDSAAVHAACAYDKIQAALFNNHKKKLCWYRPLPLPRTELVLSDTETEDIDDFSTFSAQTLKGAMARLIERVRKSDK